MEMFKMADKLKGLDNVKKGLAEDTKAVNKQIEQVIEGLSKAMIDEEVDNFNREGITFYLTTNFQASVKAEDKETLYKSLKDYGFGNLIQENVNAQTLKAFVKEQKGNNNDILPEYLEGIVNVYEPTTVRMRKSK